MRRTHSAASRVFPAGIHAALVLLLLSCRKPSWIKDAAETVSSGIFAAQLRCDFQQLLVYYRRLFPLLSHCYSPRPGRALWWSTHTHLSGQQQHRPCDKATHTHTLWFHYSWWQLLHTLTLKYTWFVWFSQEMRRVKSHCCVWSWRIVLAYFHGLCVVGSEELEAVVGTCGVSSILTNIEHFKKRRFIRGTGGKMYLMPVLRNAYDAPWLCQSRDIQIVWSIWMYSSELSCSFYWCQHVLLLKKLEHHDLNTLHLSPWKVSRSTVGLRHMPVILKKNCACNQFYVMS